MRYKEDSIKAIIKVKLDTDYPYPEDWRRKGRFTDSSHMSLSFDTMNNLYIPYRGNKAIYDHLLDRGNGSTYIKTIIEKCGISSKFKFCGRNAKLINHSPLRD
jgi:hypothetical protein